MSGGDWAQERWEPSRSSRHDFFLGGVLAKGEIKLSRPEVIIDGYNLRLEKGTGISTYSRNLAAAARRAGASVGILYGYPRRVRNRPLIDEVSFFDPALERPFMAESIGAKLRMLLGVVRGMISRPTYQRIPISGQVVTRPFDARMPAFDHIYNSPDLFFLAHAYFYLTGRILSVRPSTRPVVAHWTYPLPVRIVGAKNYYTVHDLIPLKLPYTTLDDKQFYYRMVKQILATADKIVTVSEQSKADIASLFGYHPDRIHNTYQAVDIPPALIQDRGDLERILSNLFGLQYKEYILFVGAVEPKKNVGRLIEAYLASGVDYPLILVGPKAWKHERELNLVRDELISTTVIEQNEIRVRKRIRSFDYISFPNLVCLIQGARFLTFPSLYEGFGLPVLEAMSLGTAVLASNVSSIPEVAGNAAVLVDPYNVREIRDAIIKLSSDEGYRSDLEERGRPQAENFSVERYSEAVKELYGPALTGASGK